MNTSENAIALIPFQTNGAIKNHADSAWQGSAIQQALLAGLKDAELAEGTTVEALQEILETTTKALERSSKNDAIRQIRLLGNYLRMASYQSATAREFIKQITWGLDAGALDNSCSGEKETTEAVLSFLTQKHPSRRIRVFDIGANTGEWSIHVAEKASNIDIHAFEPNTTLGDALLNALRTPEHSSRGISCTVNMFGVYSQTGKQKLYINGDSREQATLSPAAGSGCFENAVSSQDVTTIRGDEYCAAKSIEQIDYVKIDTEGTELEALSSFGEIVAQAKIGFIQFEYGAASFYTGSSLMKFFELLSRNYMLARILPEGLKLEEAYGAHLEDFKWCNYLAISRENRDFLSFCARG